MLIIFIFILSIILFFMAGFIWSESKVASVILFISGMIAWVYSFPIIREALLNV